MAPIINRLHLWEGQDELLTDFKTPEHVVVSGNGYGKSVFGSRWHFQRCLKNKKSAFSIIGAPTADIIKNVIIDVFEQTLIDHGLGRNDFKIFSSVQDMHVDLAWGHTILMRTFQKSAASFRVGYTASHAWMDESGLTDDRVPIEIAKRVRCARARALQRLYTGTPEGTKNWFARKIRADDVSRQGKFSIGDNIKILHGTSYDNPTLPEEYLRGMEAEFAWNENLRRAYLLGEVVPIYDHAGYDFDPDKHVGDYPADPADPLFLGWDFNVGSGRAGLITWIAMQQYKADLYAVDENQHRSRTTDEACRQFMKQFPPEKWRNQEIIVYGDAAAWARDTRGYINDYGIIEQELKPHYPLLRIKARRSNPSIEYRLSAVNRLFSDIYPRNFYLNKKCVKLAESFITTTVDSLGKIEKPAGEVWTHPGDAAGYVVVELYPIRKPQTRKVDFAYV
jgi:hypothetical protein